MDKPVKCFIVEGIDRDYRFVKEMVVSLFKGKYDSLTILLPAEQNIYMLYQKLKKDEFETDLIELLKEENPEAAKVLEGIERQRIDEIFLFFDYDIHHNNLQNGKCTIDALREMVSFYNNETESGKLYISYPMVEALYDYSDGYCQAFSQCFCPIDQINQYKERVGSNNRNAARHYTKHEDWKMIISLFGLRIQCLFDTDRLNYKYYSSNVTVEAILNLQCHLLQQSKDVFVLSAFPEFALDYFSEDFWNSHINRHKAKFQHCPKQTKRIESV